MKNLKKVFLVIVLLFFTNISFSQNKWFAEFRPAISFPSADFQSSNIGTGFGFEATVAYRFMQHLSVYAGWGFTTFEIKDSAFDIDETGYTFGLQFIHPIGTSENLSYLFRIGTIYNHLELENQEGNLVDDSGRGLGWQAGAGISYNIGGNWNLRPTIRYRALSRDLIAENETISIDLNYLSFGLGIAKSF